jgi:hypothetical protein
VLPSTFHEYRIDTCWVSAVKEADTTIRSVESCYVVVAMAVDVGHPGDFALPVFVVALNNAHRIDPDVLDAEKPYDSHSVGECLWDLVLWYFIIELNPVFFG